MYHLMLKIFISLPGRTSFLFVAVSLRSWILGSYSGWYPIELDVEWRVEEEIEVGVPGSIFDWIGFNDSVVWIWRFEEPGVDGAD